jgi:protein required for attachment to host cells
MKKTNHIWIVVSDGAHARFLTPNDDIAGFQPVGPGELNSPAAQLRARQLKSDRPGRSFGSSRSGVRHAIEPKHDYHKMEKHDFSAAVAHALDQARGQRAFEALVLVAPHRSLGELRSLLPDRVKACVREEIAKDLTGNTSDVLWKKLAPVVGRLFGAAL